MIAPEDKQAQAQQLINEIASYAQRLYEVIQPGMVIEVIIPSKVDLIIANQPQKKKRLLIFKPIMHVNLDIKPER